MGSICSYQKANIQTQKKDGKELQQKIKVTNKNERIDFVFTYHQSIKNLRGDMLVIFTDPSINLKENKYFAKLSTQREKIEKLAHQRLKSSPDKYMTFTNNTVTTLYYDSISLIVCDIWKDASSDQQFKKLIKEFVRTFQNVRSVVITQFPSYLGFPLKKNMNSFINEVLDSDDMPSKFNFCCLNETSKNVIKSAVELIKNPGIQKIVKQPDNASNY